MQVADGLPSCWFPNPTCMIHSMIMQSAQPPNYNWRLIDFLWDTAGLVNLRATGLEISWTLADTKLRSQHTCHSSRNWSQHLGYMCLQPATTTKDSHPNKTNKWFAWLISSVAHLSQLFATSSSKFKSYTHQDMTVMRMLPSHEARMLLASHVAEHGSNKDQVDQDDQVLSD